MDITDPSAPDVNDDVNDAGPSISMEIQTPESRTVFNLFHDGNVVMTATLEPSTETVHGHPITKDHSKFCIISVTETNWTGYDEDINCMGSFLTWPSALSPVTSHYNVLFKVMEEDSKSNGSRISRIKLRQQAKSICHGKVISEKMVFLFKCRGYICIFKIRRKRPIFYILIYIVLNRCCTNISIFFQYSRGGGGVYYLPDMLSSNLSVLLSL